MLGRLCLLLALRALLEMRGIQKAFPGVQGCAALIWSGAGEVLASSGENGAGKSTLIKVLARRASSDGRLHLHPGPKCQNQNPAAAQRLGLWSFIRVNLIPGLSARRISSSVANKPPVDLSAGPMNDASARTFSSGSAWTSTPDALSGLSVAHQPEVDNRH